MKPHKGRIVIRDKYLCPGRGLGYLYWCSFLDHPEFAGNKGHTSYIVKDDRDVPRHWEDSYEIETRNSRYTVVPSVPEEFRGVQSTDEVANGNQPGVRT